jgi:transcriptional regulator with XRE-family HTH domain
MKPDARRLELRDFLKRSRGRLRPSDVGVRSYGRRRVPGLRREEVAELVGVSQGWYELFELGSSDRGFSVGFVQRVADALRLDAAERATLFRLALPEVAEAAEVFERSARDGALRYLAAVRDFSRRVRQVSSFDEGASDAVDTVQGLLRADCITVANLFVPGEAPTPIPAGPRARLADQVMSRTVVDVNRPIMRGGAILCENAPDHHTAACHGGAHPIKIRHPDGTLGPGIHDPKVEDYCAYNSQLQQRSSLVVGLFEAGTFRGNLVAFWSSPRQHSDLEVEAMLTVSAVLELAASTPAAP